MSPISVFEAASYKTYVRDLIKSKPSGGRGTFRELALHLRVHTTFISQVFRGSKELSSEQGFKVASFLGLDTNQTDYFLGLIELERTTFAPLKERVRARLDDMRKQNQMVTSRIRPTKELTDEVKARFYSNWHFAAIRLATDIPSLRNAEALARHFHLSPAIIEEALRFLCAQDLIIQDGKQFKLGPSRTHIDQYSSFSSAHHRNWRLKAMERHPTLHSHELAFSAPMTLSHEDLKIVRKSILNLIQDVADRVKDSPSESLACLNIDLVTL